MTRNYFIEESGTQTQWV